MNINTFFDRIPLRYWGYLSLSLWGAAILLLSRPDLYNLDEGSAKSLLLAWSIADQVAASVVTFGAPDLRALLFLPVAFLWTGKVFAAKVFTTLLFAFAIWMLYLWSRRNVNAESALVASGLLAVSPLILEQIDTLSSGIYLVIAFAFGAWLNTEYRANPRSGGGWYFSQLLVSAFSVSLHPIGLAYPLALLWSWYKEPLDMKQQKYFFIGVSFISIFTILMLNGWNYVEWFKNPIESLAISIFGSSLGGEMSIVRWTVGWVILAVLVIIVTKQFRNLWSDFTGRTLLIGLTLGVTTSDLAWGIIALSLILYFGTPLLLHSNHVRTDKGFVHHRGLMMLFIIILSTVFMQADRSHYEIRQSGFLPEEDQLIHFLVEKAENIRKANEEDESGKNHNLLRVASQWPSRTMIACKCDTLPLPPAAQDPQAQLDLLHSITHILFNPHQASNTALAKNLSLLGGEIVETIALQPSGVLLHIKNVNKPANLKSNQ
ncbi:conserved membrane hypothetical protein [Candidatus Nitrotoga sp. BS]|uniref:hypothetical protein n=1 Tax=Candidatus Nitrotoga sp. BS TaxID=2890408 RepID=UPI001EF2293F|nr:hypothetical protein [Candidatus Nitrotoga sp. BS]CAH1207089.1 conserved membrane hypothetical protein [Candidatus Nitrotoga sp. BS]